MSALKNHPSTFSGLKSSEIRTAMSTFIMRRSLRKLTMMKNGLQAKPLDMNLKHRRLSTSQHISVLLINLRSKTVTDLQNIIRSINDASTDQR